MDVRSQNGSKDGEVGRDPGTKRGSTRLQSVSKIKDRGPFARKHACIHPVCHMQSNRSVTTSRWASQPRSSVDEKVRDTGVAGSSERFSICIRQVINAVSDVSK